MFQHVSPACAVAAAMALSLSAHAQSVPAPIVVPRTTAPSPSSSSASRPRTPANCRSSEVALIFRSQPATDTGLPGFGQQTFINQQGLVPAIILEGVYNTGDVLHFAYRVTEPFEASTRSEPTRPATAPILLGCCDGIAVDRGSPAE